MTSGQGTTTLAKPTGDGSYDLYGYKWFTSATDTDMALTLARDTDLDNGQAVDASSSKGLSMFYLKVWLFPQMYVISFTMLR